ncbi:sce7726 family protein [Serratia marcescens]|uniref:sce7726 family protein n=1 Tax=Serratia TaxID=613 RepID=UPI0004993536|nr:MULTISPECIES: sce7726 family protein [Serratia]AIA45780.1 bacteriophage protein [Serratia sp. FS14]MBL0877206.1 sce7726 family protein [Serratia ureilytica]MDN2469465.1 sce7726 family protein [Serratia ureilytica]NVC31862.1 sce7726 family protein [Serratia marcescens]NVC45926.1 sce7726 family protein [Serratia marcescens]
MDYQTISRIFSRPVVLELAQKNRADLFKEILRGSYPASMLEDKPIFFIYDEIYRLLQKKYRNEYIYKNEIAKKIIKGCHRYNNVSYVNEFKVNGCIADVAIFNGTSTAYEIKTELDSFDRLQEQLSVYKEVFEFVHLVIPAHKLTQALDLVDENTGVIILKENNVLKYERLAKSNMDVLSKDKIFNCFRPTEYISLHEDITGSKPLGRAADVKHECRRVFLDLNTEHAHAEMLKILRKRSLENFEKENFRALPQSLLATLLNLRLNHKSLISLRENIRETIC